MITNAAGTVKLPSGLTARILFDPLNDTLSFEGLLDESGAGEALVPFLAAVNRHLRSKPDPADRRRLMVWEGFRGAPAELPATGDRKLQSP